MKEQIGCHSLSPPTTAFSGASILASYMSRSQIS
eukprot:SAG11_NODE_37623_length_256_cov_0.643312_1_plen_33_part_10